MMFAFKVKRIKYSTMKKQRNKLFLIGLLLLISIWIAWPETKQTSAQSQSTTSNPSKKTQKGIGWHSLGFGGKNPQTHLQNRPGSSTDSALNRIEQLITHQTLSNREVAEQLRAIAQDKRMPENVRAEALGHGVILDLATFADMAADTQLPIQMAEDLLQNIINENRDPALQIQAYIDFLNHSSQEIRDQAKNKLSFILEDDDHQMADAKLKQIQAEVLQGE
jgi:uncharacterized protein (UPF0147 family)